MDTYRYEATTKDGNVITGTLEVSSERVAVDRLQEMGYFPLKISRTDENESFFQNALSIFQNRITEKDILSFTYQLGVLLDAGFPLERALSILSDLSDKKVFKELIDEILGHIRSGKSFSDALARFPDVFPVFYVNMVKAGEAGGFLEDVINRMATYLENANSLKEEVKSALIYPLFLSILGGMAIVVLLTFVVPKFTSIFSDMGEALPLPTVILLGFSNSLIEYWWALLILIISLIAIIRTYLKSARGKLYWDERKFQIPVVGKLMKEMAVSRFSRTLGTLLNSGVPILNAFQIVKGTFGSEKISGIIASVKDSTRKGTGISEALRNSDVFPPIAVHMITIGEETGRLDEMLIKIADRFDIEVRTSVKRMLSLLEPVLITLMGIAVGLIVISMLMAIFSITELPF